MTTIAPPMDPRPLGAAPEPRRSARTALAIAVTAVTVMAALVISPAPLFAIVIAFAVLVPLEKLFTRHREQGIRRKAIGTDLTYVLLSPILGPISTIALVVVAAVSLAWIPGLLLQPVVASLPPVAVAVLAFFLFDLAAYWSHRASHEIPLLWRFHSVHHSAEHLDWISAARVHPLDGLALAPAAALLVAAGVTPGLAGALAGIQLLYALFLHANVRFRLRPLHRVINTPEFHHWHHANEADAWDKNYAGLLPIWDQLFGTYFMPKDRRPSVYGIDEPMPLSVSGQLAQPFRRREVEAQGAS